MPKQTLEAIQRALQGEWPNIESRDINHGVQIILPEGTKINYFHSTGKVQVQGRDCDEKKRAEHLLNMTPKAAPVAVAGTQQPPGTHTARKNLHCLRP